MRVDIAGGWAILLNHILSEMDIFDLLLEIGHAENTTPKVMIPQKWRLHQNEDYPNNEDSPKNKDKPKNQENPKNAW